MSLNPITWRESSRPFAWATLPTAHVTFLYYMGSGCCIHGVWYSNNGWLAPTTLHTRILLSSTNFAPPTSARGRLVMARKRAQEKKANYATYNPANHHFIPLAAEFAGGPCAEWRGDS